LNIIIFQRSWRISAPPPGLGLFGRGLVAFVNVGVLYADAWICVALLHSRVTRFTQCFGRAVYWAECGRLIDGAVGLPTVAWPAQAAGQFICNAATERTDPMCWSR